MSQFIYWESNDTTSIFWQIKNKENIIDYTVGNFFKRTELRNGGEVVDKGPENRELEWEQRSKKRKREREKVKFKTRKSEGNREREKLCVLNEAMSTNPKSQRYREISSLPETGNWQCEGTKRTFALLGSLW